MMAININNISKKKKKKKYYRHKMGFINKKK